MNKDANYLILFLIILFIMWYSQGGRLNSGGIIMNPRSDSTIGLPTGQTGASSSLTTGGTANANPPRKNSVEISAGTVDGTIKAAEEYIILRASYGNTDPVDLTGWTLQNKNNEKLMIGYGSKLAYSAGINKQEDIILAPQEEAIIATGKSPIGTSFHLNLCTGYFRQNQTFVPSLPQNCPATNKTPGLYDLKDDNCIKLVENGSRCVIPTNNNYISDACSGYLNQHLNYSGCVADYGNNKDFYSPNKWYVYLGRDNEFWPGTRGTIKLYDRIGDLAAETTY